MSQPAPKRRGRPPRKVPQTEEERLASQRARSQRYYQRQHGQSVDSHRVAVGSQNAEFVYHYQPHPPALPSTTNPVIGLHLEPHLYIPTPLEQDVVAEPTCAGDYDAPGEADTDPTAAPTSWNPPVWNHHENSRAARSSLDDTPEDNYNPLFEDSQIQLELISQGQDNTGDGYDAAIDRGEANSQQLEARDEELQDLVDKVQQLLITTSPDSEAIRRDSDDGLVESL
ncbi:hypothetical protein Forpi1262_v003682 [Fusarium oxysporum f. sp. raphani]|uniref:Uncharacterized protein n=1 Tax=Fusarium oxysporum f. sp. raphani TaxID=96318 RepID=A0A8J5Q8R0_FUSOX|nr:hypothetical protein Forpi1262_v018729 [Fusarium oxysporum f. sp. raphani]KAG7405811.1 hypothetical protein Forpi1262_v018374 [Fusarium oxysporum f. sp. raphani]KAG7425410.1 hypothetical protein Forpi1262_v012981 [Fusarium oxysporum f. sp. raphani]KAG7432834.1 hypothetical protein Forpi1262_v005526 [Fusarium oxysporum f. sp. raphani]KAG7435099.1 hypothetical protein Forpi1262_v003682 [Fusarium oxysporum f. sp. raphani]